MKHKTPTTTPRANRYTAYLDQMTERGIDADRAAALAIMGGPHSVTAYYNYLNGLFTRIGALGQEYKRQQAAAIARHDVKMWQYLQDSREETAAAYRRMITLFNQFQTSHYYLNVCTLGTKALAAAHATRLKASGHERTYRPMTNHRPDNVARIAFDTTDPTYAAAVHAVAIKIKAAIRRGATQDNNTYVRHYADMIHTAVIAYTESGNELMAAQLNPDPWGLIDQMNPFRDAMRACGALDAQLTRRAARNTPIEYIANSAKVSAAERRTADRAAARDAKRRIIEAVDSMVSAGTLKPARREILLHHMRENALTAADQDLLRRIALRFGIVAQDMRGGLYIADSD